MAVYDISGNEILRSLKGKTIVTFGDSITWYDGHNQGGVPVKGYQGYLRDLGMTVTNAAVNGAPVAYHSGGNEAICVTAGKTNCAGFDYAMIAGGTNDFGALPSNIGSIASSNYNNTTVIGALQITVEKIVTDNPSVRLFLVTPLKRTGWGTANSKSKTLADYADAIKLVGEYYAVPVLDLFTMSGLNDVNMTALTLDGLHPNADGYQFLGGKLQSFVAGL